MNKIIKLIAYILVSVIAVILIVPVGLMVIGAFKPFSDFLKVPPEILPETLTLIHFKTLFTYPVLKWTLNSIFVAFVWTTLMTLVTSMTGYAFAKKEFKFKEPIFLILLTSLMIPGTVTLVPMFILMKDLHLLDTLASQIIPALVSVTMIYFYRQFVQDIPSEILDVADIDGAGELQKFFRIIIPLSKPALITVFILSFMGSWNNYVSALMYLLSPENFTLPLGIQKVLYDDMVMRVMGFQNYGLMHAAGLFMLLPMVIVFTLAHKYFEKGLWGGGHKG